jgi:hypothetical protein
MDGLFSLAHDQEGEEGWIIKLIKKVVLCY